MRSIWNGRKSIGNCNRKSVFIQQLWHFWEEWYLAIEQFIWTLLFGLDCLFVFFLLCPIAFKNNSKELELFTNSCIVLNGSKQTHFFFWYSTDWKKKKASESVHQRSSQALFSKKYSLPHVGQTSIIKKERIKIMKINHKMILFWKGCVLKLNVHSKKIKNRKWIESVFQIHLFIWFCCLNYSSCISIVWNWWEEWK